MMRHLIRYAEKEGLRELVGDVLASNQGMLEMCRGLGFAITSGPGECAQSSRNRAPWSNPSGGR